MYKIDEIRLSLNEVEDSDVFADKIRRKLKRPFLKLQDILIVKKSLDAREKRSISYVYNLAFSCKETLDLQRYNEIKYDVLKLKQDSLENIKPPIIAGAGPCGLFAGLILAEAGLKPIILERGERVEERVVKVKKFWNEDILDEESNVQFGEGGAGTFSDGKLTTGTKDVRRIKVLDEFVSAGADFEIKYVNKPHIGTDKLRDIVKNLRIKLISLGAKFRFSSKLTGIEINGRNEISAVEVNEDERIETDRVILATGHSARDVFKMLYDEAVLLRGKPFSVGTRIEHPQAMIDEVQYGDAGLGKILGAAEYKINTTSERGRGVYTFCMCPGGSVITASSEKNGVTTNGMSNSRRDSGFANSALLVDVHTEDFASEHPLAGVEFQRKYEKLAFESANFKYSHIQSDWEDLNKSKLAGCLPLFVVESISQTRLLLDRKLKGFGGNRAVFKGPETRSSSPVRIVRDSKTLESKTVGGLYPAGEGAGYAGGIMSSAVDGIRVAEALISSLE